MNYTIEIRTWDETDRQDGPALVATIDASDGSPHIADVHYKRGSYDAWRELDLQSIASLIVKSGDQFEIQAVQALPPAVEVKSARPAAVKRPAAKATAARKPTKPQGAASDWLTEALRERITSGTYGVGMRIPTRMDMVRLFPGATQFQVKSAVKALQDDGLLAPGRRGQGVIVLDPKDRGKPLPAPKKSLSPTNPGDAVVLEAYERGKGYNGAARILKAPYSTVRGWIMAAQKREQLRARPVIGAP